MEHMFYVPLFHYKVENWTYKKKFLLELYDSIKKECEIKKDTTVITNYHQNHKKLVQDIAYIFYSEIKEFAESVEISNYDVKDAWFEKSHRNNYHGIHNHGPIGYSSVCFINYDENEHSPTQFVSPFNNFMNGSTLIHSPQNITEGSIIFFPSIINHYTDPNQCDKERLIVSFNLNFT